MEPKAGPTAVEDADILDDYASDLRILGVNRLRSCTAEDKNYPRILTIELHDCPSVRMIRSLNVKWRSVKFRFY